MAACVKRAVRAIQHPKPQPAIQAGIDVAQSLEEFTTQSLPQMLLRSPSPLFKSTEERLPEISEESLFTPLAEDEIRLAIILPGKFETDVQCSIQIVRLGDLDHHPFEALSYAWDFNERPECHVTMRKWGGFDLSIQRTWKLPIRPNLLAALRRLRQVDQDVIIWVDLLCIDLTDQKEKRDHAKMFCQIFYRAWNVCLWLGEDEQMQRALDCIPKLLDIKTSDHLTELYSLQLVSEWEAVYQLMQNTLVSLL